jgi:hypothetical protein
MENACPAAMRKENRAADKQSTASYLHRTIPSTSTKYNHDVGRPVLVAIDVLDS